jgi:hypothetical protein
MFQTAGSRNEEGWVNGLDRRGFTPTKSGSEELANARDAFADNGTFNILQNKNEITLVDDACGMTVPLLVNMFDIGRENHQNDKSMGVSGCGGIHANYQLSKNDLGQPRPTQVLTKHKDGVYLKATIPWDLIYRDKKFDKQIKIEEMTIEEIQQFIAERGNRPDATGTTFKFPYSENFSNLLKSQFKDVQTDCSNLDDSWGMIFGTIKMNIFLNKHNGLPPTELKKYDYFVFPDDAYYEGKFKCQIYTFVDGNEERFVCKDPENESQYIEICKDKRGLSAKPRPVAVDQRKLDSADIMTFTSGMLINKKVFDPSNPKELTAEYMVDPYDATFMKSELQKDVIKEYVSRTSVYRNHQRITGVSLENFKVSSARGDGRLLFKIVHHRSKISYETLSTQVNRLDRIHGIQENKNQNQHILPPQYTQYSRLIEYLKAWHAKKILTYMERVIKTHDQQKKEQEAQRKIEEETRRAEERRIAEELRRQNKGKQQPIDEIQLVVTGDPARDHDEPDSEIGVPTDATEEFEESQESGEEDLGQVSEDCESEQVMASDPNNREEDSPNIEEQKLMLSSESNDDETLEAFSLEESRQYDLKLIQLLSQHIASANYTHKNGKMLYEFVMSERNN